MNAVRQVEHCGFHQREINRVAVCPLCSRDARFTVDATRDYIGSWECSNHCDFLTPAYREIRSRDCPICPQPTLENQELPTSHALLWSL